MDGSEHEDEKIERLRRAMYSRTLSEKIEDKPRRGLEGADAQVSEDFVRHDEGAPRSIVAPRTIGLMRTALWWVLAGSVVFFIAAVAFFGYYFTFGGGSGSASSNNINIAVAGPPQIEGGAPTEFQISVANRNSVPLELADLVITYPDGTRSPTDFSTALPTRRISLGQIEPGGVRQGTVSAVLSGNAGQQADIKVELEYRLAGSSAIFVASTDYSVVFGSSPLSIAIDGNQETISGQPLQLTVSVTSNTQTPVRDVMLTAQYPFGFKFASASPAQSGSGFWELGDFAPGEKKTVTIRGSLSGAQGDQRIFHFAAGTRNNATSTAIDTQLADGSFTMSISRPFLGLVPSVNGATSSVVTVSPGDNVAVSIAWQNNLQTALTNAAIVARLVGVPIDGTTIRSSNGFYRSTDTTMLWDKTTDPDLANLAPGARGTVSFSFQMPSSDVLASVINPHLDISINAAGNRLSQSGVPESLQAAADQKIAVASDLQLTAAGLYYANPFGSTGPMPPKAGSETTYAIIFTVTNTTNEINGASVTAQLPPYVRWVGIYSPNSEKVSFDQTQGTVTWDLGDIAAGVGLNGTPPRQMAIAIGFDPSTSQIGQQPALLQQITLTGTDAATHQSVTKTTKTDVTTNLTQAAKTNDAAVAGTDTGFSAANATVVK